MHLLHSSLLGELATAGVAALAIALLAVRRGPSVAWRKPLIGVVAIVAAFKAFDLIRLAIGQVRHPPLWDFSAFWMFGRVAASHQNVYDPGSYQMYAPILNPTGDVEFTTIALNIGLPYPPAGVLLVYPLGLFANISTALIFWYIAIFAAIAASIMLLWRQFFAVERGVGLIVATVLVLALSATRMNIGLAQVTFFGLFFLLLFWGERTPWRAGLWLAPLIVLRPLFLLFAIYLIARRQWGALVSLAATSVVLLLISIPLLGPNGLQTYIFHNPAQRYPGIYFIGTQCLYKLLAALGHDARPFSLATHPVYDLVAGACIIGAAFICVRCAKRQPDACLALLLAVGLWIYPNTATHYCIVLLPAMCAVWRDRKRLALRPWVIVAFFGVEYLLLDARDGASTTGLAIALDCVFFGVLAFRRPAPDARRERQPDSISSNPIPQEI